MTKFEICNKLYRIKDIGSNYFRFTEDGIEYHFNKHDTGQILHVYLVAEDKKLEVYYDCKWFYSRYNFNNEGKKLGYIVDGPWVARIEHQFQIWEKAIMDNEKRMAERAELEAKAQKEKAEADLEFFKAKFANKV